MNGEVKTYNVGKPMTWGDFKSMPNDLQKQYVKRLQLTFGANDIMLGQMFGTTRGAVMQYRNAHGIPGMSRGYRPSEQQLLAFDRFVAGELNSTTEEWDTYNKDEVAEETRDNEDTNGINKDPVKVKADVGEVAVERLQFTAVADSAEARTAYLADIGRMSGVMMPGRVRIKVLIEEVVE